jgi:tetratricopeptide (TPR) repeat protein
VKESEWFKANEIVAEVLQTDFKFTASDAKRAIACYLHEQLVLASENIVPARAFVLDRICEIVGLSFETAALSGFRSGVVDFGDTMLFLRSPDIRFGTRTKRIAVMNHASSFVMYHHGLSISNLQTKISYFKRALAILAPFDAWGFSLGGNVCAKYSSAMIREGKDELQVEALELRQKAIYYYERAISLDPLNVLSMASLAELFTKQGDLKSAEDLYLQALEIDDMCEETLIKYAAFLATEARAPVDGDRVLQRLQDVQLVKNEEV